MKKIIVAAGLMLMLVSGCKIRSLNSQSTIFPSFSIEAHRGGRGLMPENTIPAMIHAIDLGVTTLEMDTHVSSDGKVLLSHDHYINPQFILDQNGDEIPEKDNKKYILYQMRYDEIRKYDAGSRINPKFPKQKPVKTYIPLLAELIDSVQSHLKQGGKKQVFYNIETKSDPSGDNSLHPDPEKFIDLLVDVLKKKNIIQWTVIQSFDVRTLQVLNRKYPHIKTSFLIENANSFEENMKILGFIPFIISPNFKLVTAEYVNKCHQQGLKVIPWTVNTKEDIAKLMALGVDGIISDYPTLLL